MNSINNQTKDQNDTILKTEEKLLQKKCKIIGIYGLRNKITGKWYIGQSWDISNRWNEYRLLRCKRQKKIYNALLKYGYDKFETMIIEMCCPSIPQQMLDKKEAAWICHYNSVESGYNLRNGGSRGKHSDETKILMSKNGTGRQHSDETKKKISIANTGKIRSNAHMEAIKRANTGIKRSNATKSKIRNALIGKIKSEQHRENLSKSLKGRMLSEARKIQIGNFFRGRPIEPCVLANRIGKKRSEETKEKMRISNKKAWIKRRLDNEKTKQLYKVEVPIPLNTSTS